MTEATNALANDNDIFRGRSPFKGFRMEAVDHWPGNVIDLAEWLMDDAGYILPCFIETGVQDYDIETLRESDFKDKPPG
jgi:hypothetical protein